MSKELPEGYSIIDGEEEVHDCDIEDGRYCLYSPDEEPLANLHERDELIPIAWEHFKEFSQ